VSDETVRTSMNLGIFVLLGVTACVLAGFLRFILSIVRRSSSPDLVRADAPVRPHAHFGADPYTIGDIR
jgi:hypothetical protein